MLNLILDVNKNKEKNYNIWACVSQLWNVSHSVQKIGARLAIVELFGKLCFHQTKKSFSSFYMVWLFLKEDYTCSTFSFVCSFSSCHRRIHIYLFLAIFIVKKKKKCLSFLYINAIELKKMKTVQKMKQTITIKNYIDIFIIWKYVKCPKQKYY